MASLKRIRGLLREAGEELLVELAVSRGMVPPAEIRDGDTAASLRDRGLLTREQIVELERLRDLAAFAPEELPPEVATARSDPSRLLGRYTLVDPVGTGAVGTVWRAWDGELRRWVAVKRPQDPVSEPQRQRFLREARILAGLRHANLVTMYDVGEHQGRPYLVMELVKGSALRPALDLRATVHVLRKIALALHDVHRQGVVHRDVKPDNIVVDDRGEPRLVSFGSARVTDATGLTRTGTTMGTPLYMAPEQVGPKYGDISPRTDVYALGAILFQALAGRTPHVGATPGEIFAKIVADEPGPLPGQSPELEAVALRAIERVAARRYATAIDFAEELGRWLDGRPVLARPAGPFLRSWRWIRRRPVAIAITILVAASIPAGLALRSRWQELSAKADRDRAEADLVRWTAEVSDAYADLAAKSMTALRRLEDDWHAGRPGEGDLRDIEAVADAVAARWPRARSPKAWRALAQMFAGRDRALEALDAAATDAGEDPFPLLLVARARLAAYVRESALPRVDFEIGGDRVAIGDFRETASMRAHRERASSALRAAVSMRVWPRLRAANESEAYVDGAARFGAREFEAAAARLAGLREPGLGDEAAMLRGFALFNLRRLPQAAAAFEEAGRRWPRALSFAAVCRLGAGMVAWIPGGDPMADFERCIADLAPVLERDPSNADARFHRCLARLYVAQLRVSRGQPAGFEDAVHDADEAVRLGSPGARTARGLLHLAIGRIERALGRDSRERFDKAIADLPDEMADRRGLACLERAQGDAALGRPAAEAFRRAIDDLPLAIARFPTNAALPMNRANACLGLAATEADPVPLFDAAIRDYDLAFRLDSTTAAPLGNLAIAHFQIGELLLARNLDPRQRFRSAVEASDRAIKMDAAPLYLGNRALMRTRWGEVELALKGDGETHLRAAVDDATRAIALAPREGSLYFARAGARRALGELKDALADFDDALKFRANYWQAHIDKAGILETLGRRDEAAAELDLALKIVPDQPRLREWRDKLRGD